MADKSTPNHASNMEKADGDRDTARPERGDEVNPSERYGNPSTGSGQGDRGDQAGGISNRPLDEEIENQEALPERGTGQQRDIDREERIEREHREEREEIIDREGDNPRREETPRRYDETTEENPTMPSDDPTLRIEI